jgi:hypothetical protein
LDPKKVWGVVLIVLGVLAILLGASNYHIFSMADEVFTAEQAMYQQLLGVKAKKGLCLMSIVVGLLFSIFGTLMIKDTINTLENIRYKFDKVVDELLLDFVHTKLDLYKKLSNPKVNPMFKSKWFDGYLRGSMSNLYQPDAVP